MRRDGGLRLPSRDEVHVWVFSLAECDAAVERYLDHLSREERSRMARLHFSVDQRRYGLARAKLRALLGRYLGLSARALELAAGPGGKPSLVAAGEADLRFNLSHSEDVLVVALACGRAVGVDAEHSRPLADLEGVLELAFSPRERAAVRRLREPRRLSLFYRLWTRKEAYLKALGEGIGADVSSVDMLIAGPPPLHVPGRGGAALWSVHDLTLGAELVGAVVGEGGGWRPVVRWAEPHWP